MTHSLQAARVVALCSIATIFAGCVTSTGVRQDYKSASTGGRVVVVGGQLNSLSGGIEITIDDAVVAKGRATPVVGSNVAITGEYKGKPVTGQCIEVPVVESRKLLGHTMTRCKVSINKEAPITVELYNDSRL
jgi:hypothetical protein